MHAYTVQRLYKALLDDISQVRAALLSQQHLMNVTDTLPETFEANSNRERPKKICPIIFGEKIRLNGLFFTICSAATFSAGSILVHRRVWRPAGIWAV